MTNKTTKPLTERKYGVEIEFTGIDQDAAIAAIVAAGIEIVYEGYNHSTRSTWKLVQDCSCGLEAVSPILQGEEGLRQITAVCNALDNAGAIVNRDTGYHLHMSASDFSLPQFKNLLKLWIKFEDVIDTFQPQSRRANNNSYCRSNLNQFNIDGNAAHACRTAFEAINAATTIEDLKTLFYSRYMKLNIQAFWRHRTIEVRHHAGTLNAEKATNWVRLMDHFYATAAAAKTIHIRPDNGESGIARHKWFFAKDTPLELRHYYRRRAKELNRFAA